MKLVKQSYEILTALDGTTKKRVKALVDRGHHAMRDLMIPLLKELRRELPTLFAGIGSIEK